MTKFAETLLYELERKGITQKQLADFLETKSSTIHSWIVRDTIPAADVALKVAKFLNVSVEYLIDGAIDESPGDFYIKKIIESLKNFSPADKEKITHIADLFYKLEEADKELYCQLVDFFISRKSPVNTPIYIQ